MINHDKILITGSSKGIGLAITEKILSHNVKVVGISMEKPEFNKTYKNYCHFNIDFSNLNRLDQDIYQVLKEHPDISGVINNAGYGKFSNIENFSSKQIRDYMNANLTSHIIVTRAILPHFKRRKAGNVIFIGSEAALVGSKQGSLYCASKFGLRGLAQALARELHPQNIHVGHFVIDGSIDTNSKNNLDDEKLDPDHVANCYLEFHRQARSAWAWEIELRPWAEKF